MIKGRALYQSVILRLVNLFRAKCAEPTTLITCAPTPCVTSRDTNFNQCMCCFQHSECYANRRNEAQTESITGCIMHIQLEIKIRNVVCFIQSEGIWIMVLVCCRRFLYICVCMFSCDTIVEWVICEMMHEAERQLEFNDVKISRCNMHICDFMPEDKLISR